nr:PREDICTED: sodium/bile acid cotransporter 5 isoform X1 [Bemisia tabaci]
MLNSCHNFQGEMCPLAPLHLILVWLLLLCPLWFVSSVVAVHVAHSVKSWSVSFRPQTLKLNMYDTAQLNFTSEDDLPFYDPKDYQVTVETSDPEIAEPIGEKPLFIKTESLSRYKWGGSFNLSANFLGYANIRIKMVARAGGAEGRYSMISNPLRVAVSRKMRVIDHVFTSSVAILVAVIFINFGCALDWPLVRKSLCRPIGPVIGFISQFLFMPLISFFLAKLLFPHSIAMQLGLFFTGVAPGGGASNIWIYLLGGNLNLSITMTAISTFAAFFMIPFWTFTLGRLIFNEGNMTIPYSRIASFAVALVIPLSIGFLLQRKVPKVSKFLVGILKHFSACLIVFIIVFATVTNFYLFKLFSWQILVAGLGLPWLGYLFGYIFATVCRQSSEDRLAISIETGIQNTGIAIFMLRFALGQPEADLTTVVPVAVAIMTPFPLLGWYLCHKLQKRYKKQEKCMSALSGEDHLNNCSEQPLNGHIKHNGCLKDPEKF